MLLLVRLEGSRARTESGACARNYEEAFRGERPLLPQLQSIAKHADLPRNARSTEAWIAFDLWDQLVRGDTSLAVYAMPSASPSSSMAIRLWM